MLTRPIPISVVLGLLTAVGLFATDMYLPSLPAIGADLGADSGQVQASLIAFFIAIALCQVVYGPLSDMFGRKPPLYFGLGLFALGSVGCALAPTIEWLIAFRFLQGMGACAGMVIPRAVVRDLHTGVAAAHMMARLMLVFSVSPLMAPLAGSFVAAAGGWQANFWIMGGACLLGLVLVALRLPETRPPEQRTATGFAGTINGYRTLLRDPHYLGLVLIASFGMASYMTYLANSSFVLIEHYGLSPSLYSVMFSINAISFIGMSQLNGRLARRFGLKRVIGFAIIGFVTTMVALLGVTALGIDRLGVMATFLFIGYGFLGSIIPTAAVLALESHGRIAGTASAMMGTLQFITAAAVMGLSGLYFDGTSLPMITTIALCSLVVSVLGALTLRPSARKIVSAE